MAEAWAFPFFDIQWNVFGIDNLAIIISGILFVCGTLIFIMLWRIVSTLIQSALNFEKERTHVSTIISKLADGLIEYDREYKVVLINSKAREMLELSNNDVLGQKITREDMEDRTLGNLAHVIFTDEKKNEVEIALTNSAGDAFDVRILSQTLVDEYGRPAGILKVIHDATRENLMSKLKSEFISIAAHQLRTPLSALKWVLHMLIEGDMGKLTKVQLNTLQRGYDTNERMIRLVNDLLDVARIEEGRFGYDFVYGSIREVVRQTIARFDLYVKQNKITLTLRELNTKIPKFRFDPGKISLALENLIDNAVKYTLPGGSVEVAIDMKDNFVEIIVKDTGAGIPKHQLNRVFTKFFRGENVVRMQTDGSGLGLFIARNIIVRHGGDIQIISEERKGTTATLTLPVSEELIPEEEVYEKFITEL